MRVEIAGAGLMGRLIGWRLTQAGADVTLYERASRSLPESAAHAAAAMLAPVSEYPDADPEIFAMGRHSLTVWPALLDALNVPYGTTGSLLVAHGPDGPLLDKFHRELTRPSHQLPAAGPDAYGQVGQYLNVCAEPSAGEPGGTPLACKKVGGTSGPDTQIAPEARWVDAQAIAALEPALAGRFQRGLFLPGEGWLDNRALLDALGRKCGAIRFQNEVDPRDLRADLVIDCRGVSAGLPGLRGVRGELIRVRAAEVLLSRPVRLMHPRYQLYIAPRQGGEYLIGATQIESESQQGVTVRSALELLSAAFALHPGFAEAEILELCTALRPAFADNLPRVVWDGEILRINGLYRHGFLIAPALLEQVCAKIATRQSCSSDTDTRTDPACPARTAHQLSAQCGSAGAGHDR